MFCFLTSKASSKKIAGRRCSAARTLCDAPGPAPATIASVDGGARTGTHSEIDRSKNVAKAEHVSRCCSAAACWGRRQRPRSSRPSRQPRARPAPEPCSQSTIRRMRGRGSPQPNRSQWRTKAKLSSLASYGGAVAHAAHTRLHEPRHHTAGCRPARHGREHVWPCRVWGRLGSSPHGPTNGQVDGTHPSDPRPFFYL